MKYLFFDTETSGLPTRRNPPVIAMHNWPHILQLSYILYDTETHNIINLCNNIVKIDSTTKISPDSIKIHNITREKTQSDGVDIVELLTKFNENVCMADYIIAHNLSFDKNMIMVECLRHKIPHSFSQYTKKTAEYCTMKNSVDLCKIIAYDNYGNDYYKYPKLSELYKYLFNYVPDGLHNSMIDILLCIRCYFMIVDHKDICDKSSAITSLFEKYSLY